MVTEHRAVQLLRVFLVLLFGVLLVLQLFSLPGQFAHMAQEQPDDAWLRWPATVIAGFLVLCAQVVVVATWRLLSLVAADRIFSDSARVWVDAIVRAIAAAEAVLVGVFLWVGFSSDDPGLPLLLSVLVLGGGVVALLVVVLRALLRQATTLRTDLDTVI